MARIATKLFMCAVFCAFPVTSAWADGAVYALTNALGNNQILIYHRDSQGNLSLLQTAATGGGGSGLQLAAVDSLGSAGSGQLDPDRRLLFVVNTETAAQNNGAGTYNTDCQRGLNPPSFPRSPAQLLFTPNGDQLVVTVKGTNTIYVFPIDEHGRAGDQPAITQAPGPVLPTYFGIAFNRQGHLLVTETFGTATTIPKGGVGALSSFTITDNGKLLPISSDVGDGGTAACWIALDPLTGNYAYVSNNLSASISSYTVGRNGTLTLLNGTAAAGSGPNDLAVASEGGASFLYVVDAGTGTVGAFRINADGSLTAINGGSGLPVGASAQGLAAF